MTAFDADHGEQVDRAVLLAALDTVDTIPSHLAGPVATAAAKAARALRIVLVSPLFDAGSEASALGTTRFYDVQRVLTHVYVQAAAVAQKMGKILMDVDVLLKGANEPLHEHVAADVQVVYQVRGFETKVSVPSQTQTIWLSPNQDATPHAPTTTNTQNPTSQAPSSFPVTALGGTFDHLHAGHKILLSMAAWITATKLIVGMTDDSLLQRKANKHVIEPLHARMARTRAFLALFKPSLALDLVPLTDVAGPTGWDPDIQALVVSKETLGGAAAIEKIRREKGFPPLQTFVIDVISPSDFNLATDDVDALRKAKMSSTAIREWIVEQERAKSPS